MSEHELELRLQSAARALDADVPAFEVGRLRSVSTRRLRGRALLLACVLALTGVVVAPAAVSAIGDLFHVDEVPAIGALEPGVTAAYSGRSVPFDVARAQTPFHVWTIASLGSPHDSRVRDDIAGGMVTFVYRRATWVLLTQWRTAAVSARIAVVPVDGKAEEVAERGVHALWIEGTARGIFTLVGADGTVHRESFEVGSGALLWKRDGMSFLLQGAGSPDEALGLAVDVRP